MNCSAESTSRILESVFPKTKYPRFSAASTVPPQSARKRASALAFTSPGRLSPCRAAISRFPPNLIKVPASLFFCHALFRTKMNLLSFNEICQNCKIPERTWKEVFVIVCLWCSYPIQTIIYGGHYDHFTDKTAKKILRYR